MALKYTMLSNLLIDYSLTLFVKLTAMITLISVIFLYCHLSNKGQPRKTGYTLHGHNLEEVDSAKYLGVTIHHKLHWNEHISNIRTKANRTLGFIKPNIHGCKPQIKSMAYQTMVRPTLEYASTVWDPTIRSTLKLLKGFNGGQPSLSQITTGTTPQAAWLPWYRI